jgi:predicted N-acetyltransferase YhbS
MMQILPLDQIDPAQVEQLLDSAFGPDRHGRTAYRIREGMTADPALSIAAVEGDMLVGSLQIWPCALHTYDDAVRIGLVGPVAVAADRQGQGVGTVMMNHMLAQADGGDPLVLIGDPEYYGRFGFTAEATAGWEVPGPVERRRLLARTAHPLPRHGMLGPRR